MVSIDGQGKIAGQAEVTSDMCSDRRARDALFGKIPDDAYNVNVPVNINTTATAAQAAQGRG